MSVRRGYWFLKGNTYDGPFQTIREAKEASSAIKNSDDVSIRSMIEVERFVNGQWVTVH